MLKKLHDCFDQKASIPECYEYIFKDTYAELGRKSTQYLGKWVSTFRLLQKQGGHQIGDGGNTATVKRRKGTVKTRDEQIQRKAKVYSQAHKQWLSAKGPDGLSKQDTGGGG